MQVVKPRTPKKLNHAILKTDRSVLSCSCHDPAICFRASTALSSGRPSPPCTNDRMGSPTALMTRPQKPCGRADVYLCIKCFQNRRCLQRPCDLCRALPSSIARTTMHAAIAHLEADGEQRRNLILGQVFLLDDELQRREELGEDHQHVAQRRVSGDRQLARAGPSLLCAPSGSL